MGIGRGGTGRTCKGSVILEFAIRFAVQTLTLFYVPVPRFVDVFGYMSPKEVGGASPYQLQGPDATMRTPPPKKIQTSKLAAVDPARPMEISLCKSPIVCDRLLVGAERTVG